VGVRHIEIGLNDTTYIWLQLAKNLPLLCGIWAMMRKDRLPKKLVIGTQEERVELEVSMLLVSSNSVVPKS